MKKKSKYKRKRISLFLILFFIIFIILIPPVSAMNNTTKNSDEKEQDFLLLNNKDLDNVRENASSGKVSCFGICDYELPEPLDNLLGSFLFVLLQWLILAIIGFIIAHIVLRTILKILRINIDHKKFNFIKTFIFGLILLYGFIVSISLLPIPDSLLDFIILIFNFVIVIISGYIVYKTFRESINFILKRRIKKRKTKLDRVILPIVDKFGIILIFLFILMYILSMLGIDLTLLIAGMGLAGLVIAFAAQDTLSNFFAGIFLISDRPFDIGDRIVLENGNYYDVLSVGLRSSRLYDILNHRVLIMPNNKLANQDIYNITIPDRRLKIRVEIGVAYGSDLKLVFDVLKSVTNSHPNVLNDNVHETLVRLTGFGDSSVNYLVIAWVDDFENQWTAGSEIRDNIHETFLKKGITIPFPQRTVWMMDEMRNKDK
jgi:small-conductance mechanosensitive channel